MGEMMNRRSFLGAIGISAVTVAAGAALAGCSTSDETKGSVDTENNANTADVIVIGASAGGLLTAAHLVDAGKSVIVLEASKETGGTALISSGGVVRSFKTYEETLEKYPDLEGMPLPKAFIENFEPAMQFIRDKVVPDATAISEMIPSLADDKFSIYMGGTYEARREYFDNFDYFITSGNGQILTSTAATGLIQDEDGRIKGVTAQTADGPVSFYAEAVLISTGGFQADPEMMVRYYGRYADNAVCRAIPYNDGAGIRWGLAAGGKMSKGCGACYGHEVLANPIINYRAYEDPLQAVADYEDGDKDAIRATFSTQNSFDGISIHLNLEGRRFYDEGYGAKLLTGVTSMGSYMNNAAILEQPFARAISVFDSQAFNTEGGGYSAGVQTAVDNIEKHGGTIIKADTLKDLFKKLNEAMPLVHQIPVANAIATINEYNDATAKGAEALEALNPSRTDTGMAAITVPPFYAIPVTAGVSATQSGLVINEECAVLAQGTNLPIAGLYAIPLAAGGAYYQNYMSTALGVLCGFGYLAALGIEAHLA